MNEPPSPPPHNANSKTYGSVQNLEHFVSDDWWTSLFGPTYLLTDSDVLTDALTREEVDRVLDLLTLPKEASILDLCCGQGRHSMELARQGYRNVSGLDQSEFLIDRARADAANHNLDASFQVGDCRDLPFPAKSFEAVLLLGNSFGYFAEPDDDMRVLSEVRRVLRPDGHILLDISSGHYLRTHFDPRSWEWLDDEHLVCRERELANDGRRLVSREVLIHVERGVLRDQFYAERIYDRRQIKEALSTAGFTDIRFGSLQETRSERDQDLGMMAQRLWITARAPERVAANSTPVKGVPTNNHAPPVRHIAVLLGDPTLPDETKLGGSFSDDDIEVVDRLKAALDTLDGYAFEYFDSHATLLSDLQQGQDRFDLALNFCDEGLQNKPRWELHVPALLDTLKIAYSGAGPQTLAHCYDKSLVRGVAREIGVPVAPGIVLAPGESPPGTLPFELPALVKPNTGDNSAGITQQSLVHTADELTAAVSNVRQHVGNDRTLLIESFLPGKDLTFGLIGNPGSFLRMPITEDDYSELPADLPPLCGFEAKWLPDSPYWTNLHTIEAHLPAEVKSTIEQKSELMFQRLNCRDYARFDWRLDAQDRPCLLEVNPNPGWCWDGHLVDGAAFAGYTYAEVLQLILEAALQRCEIAYAESA